MIKYIIILLCLTVVGLSTESKLYIRHTEGPVKAFVDNRPVILAARNTIPAQQAYIITGEAASVTLVYSNGVGMYIAPNSVVYVRVFSQAEFASSRNDLAIEPSISHGQTAVLSGLVAICTNELVAGTKLVYSTFNSDTVIRGGKVVIESRDSQTTVYLLEGDASARIQK